MKRRLLAAVIVFGAIGSAADASERCNVPMSEWQPREALQKKLEAEGWKVQRIKTDDGCYEVYATNDKGARVEARFDPKTFETARIEDDE